MLSSHFDLSFFLSYRYNVIGSFSDFVVGSALESSVVCWVGDYSHL